MTGLRCKEIICDSKAALEVLIDPRGQKILEGDSKLFGELLKIAGKLESLKSEVTRLDG